MNRPNPEGRHRIEMLATVLVIDYFRSFNTNHYSLRDSKKPCDGVSYAFAGCSRGFSRRAPAFLYHVKLLASAA